MKYRITCTSYFEPNCQMNNLEDKLAEAGPEVVDLQSLLPHDDRADRTIRSGTLYRTRSRLAGW